VFPAFAGRNWSCDSGVFTSGGVRGFGFGASTECGAECILSEKVKKTVIKFAQMKKKT
jgi:hypothetical protein